VNLQAFLGEIFKKQSTQGAADREINSSTASKNFTDNLTAH
jgi:hypothetical protein